MIKKFFGIISLIIISFITTSSFTIQKVDAVTINGGVSLIDEIPTDIYGAWKVNSKIIYTNNPLLYSAPNIDFWNILRNGEVLTLVNPLTGAHASITVKDVKNNTMTFQRHKKSQYEEVTETPTITVSGNNFWGVDKFIIKKYKNNSLTRVDVVEFRIEGTKINGQRAW